MCPYIMQSIAGNSDLHILPLFLEKLYPVIIIYLLLIIITLLGLLIYFLESIKIISKDNSIPSSTKSDPVLVNSIKHSLQTTISLPEETQRIHPTERYALFVDSENLYMSLRDMLAMEINSNLYSNGGLKKATEQLDAYIRGGGFCVIDFLNDVIGGRNCVIKKYFLGYPRIALGEETPATIKNQRNKREFIKFIKDNGYDVPEGGVEVKIHGRVQEKGVDTLLTMHVYKGALKDDYDTAIIVSSDRDFLPLIKEINLEGKRFIYVTLNHNISKDMKRVAYRTKVYNLMQMKKFIKNSKISKNGIAKD